jgi:hypothetical protein
MRTIALAVAAALAFTAPSFAAPRGDHGARPAVGRVAPHEEYRARGDRGGRGYFGIPGPGVYVAPCYLGPVVVPCPVVGY